MYKNFKKLNKNQQCSVAACLLQTLKGRFDKTTVESTDREELKQWALNAIRYAEKHTN